MADGLGLPLTALTFDPHPMSVVGPRSAPTSLASLAHRIDLLRAAGADEVYVLPFDETTAALAPEEFARRVLADRLGARAIVVGEDFRFGRQAAGSVTMLAALGPELGFSVHSVALAGDVSERWSSTRTRALVESGDVRAAAEVLGRDYRLEGVVVHGDQIGRAHV